MSPSTLMVGPRGRRVLLELVMMLDDAVRGAADPLAYALDPARGRGRWVFGWTVGGGPVEGPEFEEQFVASAPTVPEFADLLERLELPGRGPTREEMHAAVTRSVAAARYWQEPDGEDILLGRKELRRALRRLAAWAAPSTPQWWSGPIEPQQHAIAWHGAPFEPGHGIAEWREQVLAEEQQARRELPRDPEANYSGIWWSFPSGAVSSGAIGGAPTGLDWSEDISEDHAAAAPVDASGARVLEIADTGAWNTLCWEHPLEVTASRRHDWYRVSGLDTRWVIPDWAALAGRYDAVHLPVAAYLTGSHPSAHRGKGGPHDDRRLGPRRDQVAERPERRDPHRVAVRRERADVA